MGNTANFSLPYPDGMDSVVVHTDVKELADKVDDQIFNSRQLAAELADIAAKAWDRSGSSLGVSANINTLENGTYAIWAGDTAVALGLPTNGLGVLHSVRFGTGAGVQYWITRSTNPTFWIRSELSATWSDWVQVGGPKDDEFIGLLPASPGSLAQTAMSITTGHGGGQTTGQGFARGLQRMPLGATRARIGIRNWNPRYNMADSPAAALNSISLGKHDGGTSQSLSWVSVQPSGSTGTEGFLSRWVNLPDGMAGSDVLVAFGWQSSGDVQNNIGYGFTGTSASNAITGTGTATNTLPFFIYLEVEIPATRGRIANFADSIGSGVSASKVMYDSWLDQYCRKYGYVPQHWSHSGDQGDSWADPSGKKWSLYGKEIVLADAVIYAMGSNMIFRPTTPTLQECIDVTVDNIKNIRKHISPNVYGATITPRTGVTGAGETLRREYNAWMKASPLFRDVFDMSAAVSTSEGVLNPAYDADGIHFNTAGYAAMASAIERPLADRGVTVDQSAGRVVKVWDYLNNREQMIYGDTGLRKLTPNALFTDAGQEVTVSREGSIVSVTGWRLAAPSLPTGETVVVNLPVGFRPHNLSRFAGNTFRDKFMAVSGNGDVTITDPSAPVDHFNVTFRTVDPWPTSLPGSAVGVIPHQ